ncbi:hypothetical protein BPJM79_40396 [Bacillus pumilus]
MFITFSKCYNFSKAMIGTEMYKDTDIFPKMNRSLIQDTVLLSLGSMCITYFPFYSSFLLNSK